MYFETVRSKDATWIKDKIGAKLNSMIVSASSPKMTVMEINGFDRETLANRRRWRRVRFYETRAPKKEGHSMSVLLFFG